MKALLVPLALCLALTACAVPAGTREAPERSEYAGNPMAGRLCGSYGVGKDGNSLWRYRQDLGEWEALIV